VVAVGVAGGREGEMEDFLEDFLVDRRRKENLERRDLSFFNNDFIGCSIIF